MRTRRSQPSRLAREVSRPIVRLDGKAFHSWTKKSGCVRPFDHTFIDMMAGLAQYLCENIGVRRTPRRTVSRCWPRACTGTASCSKGSGRSCRICAGRKATTGTTSKRSRNEVSASIAARWSSRVAKDPSRG
ncbi:MAG: hypothetical protein IJQ65_09875 [Kiritimatiellae bacterium]|nr:hypothetical protein [Kiritimatiellia bacterium]